ncbi:MAG: hypothetical protein E7653_04495 [Ruminococcaceae bacterium]|nr:hypothetical protein [Oscillospiraceae bacterium]
MKKRTSILILAALICLVSILLTSCANKSATSIVIGENGNWIIDGNDTGIKAQGTDGSKVTVGENGNWFVDGVDTGIIAVPEKYVVDVKTEHTYDSVSGEEYIITTLLYNDGTTDVQKKSVLSRITDIFLSYSGYFIAGYEPLLRIRVERYNYLESSYIAVTDDMWMTPKPDFTKAGDYNIVLNYCGQIIESSITVLEAPEELSVTDAYMYDYAIRKGTPFSETSIHITFSNGYSYEAPLSTASFVSIPDFNTPGEYYIAYEYGGVLYYSEIFVYEPGTFNMNNVSLDFYNTTLSHNDTEALETFKKDLIGSRYSYSLIYYHNADEYRYGYITEDMIDMSALDITKPGVYPIRINIECPLGGKLTYDFEVTVQTTISGDPIKTYTTTNTYLLGEYTDTLYLYENGIASFGGYTCSYVRNGNEVILSGVPTCDYAKLYLTVNDDTLSFDATIVEGTPKNIYTLGSSNYTFKVYNDHVSIYYQHSDSNAFLVITLSNNIVNDHLTWNGITYHFLANGKYIYH